MSWGTKGSDKAEALPSVSSSKAKDTDGAVVEDKTQAQADVDAAFKETVTRAITKINKKEVPEKPTLDDENKTFRTRLVAVWVLSNAGLAVAIQNINGLPSSNAVVDDEKLEVREHDYFTFILYSTFGLSLIRFIGVSFCIVSCTVPLIYMKSSACTTSSNGMSSASSAEVRFVLSSHPYHEHFSDCAYTQRTLLGSQLLLSNGHILLVLFTCPYLYDFMPSMLNVISPIH